MLGQGYRTVHQTQLQGTNKKVLILNRVVNKSKMLGQGYRTVHQTQLQGSNKVLLLKRVVLTTVKCLDRNTGLYARHSSKVLIRRCCY